jgi:hypothetical protein
LNGVQEVAGSNPAGPIMLNGQATLPIADELDGAVWRDLTRSPA